MKMDINTKRNLELTENIRTKEKKYSLLWLLDKTKTAMGSRKLKNYILNPLVNKEKIEYRYNVVETLINEFILKEELRELLNSVYDLERLSGRIAFGTANARDLLQLKTSLEVLPDINKILKNIKYKEINEFKDLHDLLEKSIYEDAPITLKEGYLIKDGYNSELDEIKLSRKGNKDFVSKLEQEERESKDSKQGIGFVLGFFFSLIGLLIGFILYQEKKGDEMKTFTSGWVKGFLTSFVLAVAAGVIYYFAILSILK